MTEDNPGRRSMALSGAPVQCKTAAHPDLESYFVRATLRHALRTRNPYDFIETYLILRDLFGYKAKYVNLGYWNEGFDTIEPGRQLTLELAGALGLSKGGRLLDVGSGLGQAAVDLCRYYDLERVVGINLNQRQVAFANALARSEELDNRICHIVGDASSDLGQFSDQRLTSIIAMECAGHFREPEAFLRAARAVLVPGGRIAISLNVATPKLSLMQRGLLYAAFGFTPAPLDTWVTRLERAGFSDVRTRDLTDIVLVSGLTFALNRAARRSSTIHPFVARYVKLQMTAALRSVSRGALKYCELSASV
jgi:SAM-dependent methyltransferase